MMTLLDVTRELVSAWKFLWATPKRRLLVLLPVAFNVVLWVGVIPVAFIVARWLTSLALPDARWAVVLSVVMGAVAIVAVVVLAAFVFTALTAVIGAPFYGALAEEALQETGWTFVQMSWYREVWRACVFTCKLGVLFVVLQGGLVALNVIPVLGTILHVVGAFTVALLLFALEFFGEVFAKASLSFRQQVFFLFRHHETVLAFAVPVFFLLLVPGLNLFVPPLAVVAASRIYVIIMRV